ncbi:MAG: DEAD/DEAH box helicase family protein [Erysipelothrix sp.]|nr:DEAD/DEAH box helicase family protein [Erysipelothrix sp.]
MNCPLCQNTDKRSFIMVNDELRCRRCITYQMGILEKTPFSYAEDSDPEYTLPFELSEAQKKLASDVAFYVEAKQDVLVYAACGAGKTEIILDLIQATITKGKTICIAIPRRQVVLELSERLSNYFQKLKVIPVCEGYTSDISGDLIVCTTHQLFRFEKMFDVIILDEPDAFPYVNNELLQSFMKRASRGNIVYLTATPDESMLALKTVTLFKRFHGHPLLVPTCIIHFSWILIYRLYHIIKRHDHLLIFVPTIHLAKRLSKVFRIPCIHSQTDNKQELLDAFRKHEHRALFTTTILERGVTFEGVNICVLFANDPLFSKASLIQIAGRVGRSSKHPYGYGYFLSTKVSKKVDACLDILNMMNA